MSSPITANYPGTCAVLTRRPSDAVLLLLAEVAACIQRGQDDGLGAPEAGHKARTVDTASALGLLLRSHVGDSDTEQGPRRLRLTPAGEHALAKWGVDARRFVSSRGGVA